MESFFTKGSCRFPPTAALNGLIEKYRQSWDVYMDVPKVDAGQEYDTCNQETQRELFLQLWSIFERVYHLPVADRKLYPGTHLEPEPDSEEGESEEINLSANPSLIKDHFLKHWVNGNGNPYPDTSQQRKSSVPSDRPRAERFELTRAGRGTTTTPEGTRPPKRKLSCSSSSRPLKAARTEGTESSAMKRVYWHGSYLKTAPGASDFYIGRFPTRDSCRIWELISSPLLLYRLIAVFGMHHAPEEEIDNYKCVWEYSLYWTAGQADDKLRGRLTFYDSKGGPGVKFWGHEEASKSALKLFEWLVGDNVPHTYDSILAGCAA